MKTKYEYTRPCDSGPAHKDQRPGGTGPGRKYKPDDSRPV